MKKFTFATVVAGALAALAIGLAGPSSADAGSNPIPLPPDGPVAVYPLTPSAGANPYTPIGVNPYVPYGVWAQR
jgi:hypothetical protein